MPVGGYKDLFEGSESEKKSTSKVSVSKLSADVSVNKGSTEKEAGV